MEIIRSWNSKFTILKLEVYDPKTQSKRSWNCKYTIIFRKIYNVLIEMIRSAQVDDFETKRYFFEKSYSFKKGIVYIKYRLFQRIIVYFQSKSLIFNQDRIPSVMIVNCRQDRFFQSRSLLSYGVPEVKILSEWSYSFSQDPKRMIV